MAKERWERLKIAEVAKKKQKEGKESRKVGEENIAEREERRARENCSSLLAEEFRLLPEIGDEQQTIHKQ
ncbi:hypothetical protein OUZ56_017005 [Daphnia magna]|uniref:Uncharacterized protein n=1 Tax=Daphnia magna TaxID=35525 RepID=A0ABR0ARX3_9CRUS|nr:hypothetical protein OUZ56_017005 [Daphnia magna]